MLVAPRKTKSQKQGLGRKEYRASLTSRLSLTQMSYRYRRRLTQGTRLDPRPSSGGRPQEQGCIAPAFETPKDDAEGVGDTLINANRTRNCFEGQV